MTATSDPRGTEQHGLLLELAHALKSNGSAIPADLWGRMRGAWAEDQLARLLDAAGVERARWPEPLDGRRGTASASRGARADPRVVLVVASLGVFMAFVDDTVVGIAFPNILQSFPDSSLSGLSWVLNAYNIAFAALMVPAGRLADLFGRRRVYVAGVVLFTLGSALAAAAPSLAALIAARTVQGIGAAVIVPASLAIVLHAFPAARRAQAVAVWSATAALAAGIGPAIGGVLVDLSDWRLVFLINIPIGVATWWLAGRHLVESRAPGARLRPDLRGAMLLALSIGALTLAIVQGPEWGWASAGVIAAALAAAATGALIARRCVTHPAPVIDVELLRTPGFGIISVLTVVGAAGFFAIGLANVLFMIEVWGYSPLEAGLATTPTPFLSAIAAGLAGRLALRYDARRLVLFGAAVWTAGPIVLLVRMEREADFLGAYLPAAALLAVGIGFAFPLVSDAAVAVAPRGRYAGATALNGTIRQVGAAIGVAILAVLLGDRTGELDSYREGWIFAAVCFAFVTAGALALHPLQAPHHGDDEELLRRRGELAAAARAAGAVTRAPAPPAPVVQPDESDEALLSQVELFAGLSAADRRRLALECRTVRLPAGAWLFREGDPADALYIVRNGRLEALLERDGRPAEPLRELGRGAAVGELALLSAAPRSASVRARRDAVLLRLDKAPFERLLTSSAGTAVAITRTLGGELQRSRRRDDAAHAPARATTLALVRLAGDPKAARVEAELVAALGGMSRLARLDPDRLRELAPGEDDAGVALAQVLDRVEGTHDLVLLSASGRPGDAWLDCCLRQADRVVLVVGDDVTGWASQPGMAGCDVVLLGPAGRPAVSALLDRVDPRSTHRIRGRQDVLRLARRLAGRSVGLVLSGGGARAFAHIGVIEELLAAGITIDRIGGSSMGAFVGALLAQGMDAGEIDACCYREFVRRNPMGDYRFPRVSLLRGGRARAMLERNLPGLIEDLPTSFSCAATDVIAAELVVHRRGALAAAVGASMCLPGVFPPVAIGQRLLVDGAVFDNLPVEAMVAEGEGPIIASDVTQADQRSLAPGEAVPEVGLIDTLTRVMLLGRTDTEELGRRHASLYIQPDAELIGALEFHMLDEARDAGRRAALTALEHAPATLF